MPDMPRVAIRSLIVAFPASKLVLPNKMAEAPLISVMARVPASPATSANNSGWKNTANTVANAVDTKSVMMDGTFLAIMMAVTKGTIISHPEIWNFPPKTWVNSAMWLVASAW